MTVNSGETTREPAVAIENGLSFRSGDDRRRRARLQLQLPVQFHRDNAESPIYGTTQNMSSEGLFCLSHACFTPGESILCSIECPAYAPDMPERKLLITCRVRVLRTVLGADQEVNGVACRIEDFECSYLK
jgi:hypothetical protein